MGAPNEAYYPNVQQMTKQAVPMYEQVQHTAAATTNKAQAIIMYIGNLIGWGWILTACIIGGLVIVTFLFKAYIKKKVGNFLKWLSDWVNG